MVIPTLKTCYFEASEDIITKFKSQALYIIKIKYWKASGSGNPPSFIPALRKIVILGLKTGLWQWYTGISVHIRIYVRKTVPRLYLKIFQQGYGISTAICKATIAPLLCSRPSTGLACPQILQFFSQKSKFETLGSILVDPCTEILEV